MNKQIRTVDQKAGIVQITTVDDRWYARPTVNTTTGLPEYQFVPSVTWITEHYPKGIAFYKWLANKGWDESVALKEAAGDKGSKVHAAVTDLIDGKTVTMDACYVNPSTEQPEPLTLDEYTCLMGFSAWHQQAKPEIVAHDLVLWNDAVGYAGTLDFLYVKQGILHLPDVKTGQYVWPSHELQVSAYRHCPQVQSIMDTMKLTEIQLEILQIGYKKNQRGFKVTEVNDQFPLFLATKQIWAKETAGQSPSQKDYPLSITLAPAAPPVADAGQGATPGGQENGTSGRRQVRDRVREGGRGRVVGGDGRGSAVRRSPGVQVKK